MKKILTAFLLTLFVATGFAQGGFIIPKPMWDKFYAHKNQKLAKHGIDRATISATDTGILLYGTTGIVVPFVQSNGVGLVQPGIEGNLVLAKHYDTNVVNYANIGGFVSVGGIGNTSSTNGGLSPSLLIGGEVGVTSYGGIGYAYEAFSKKGSVIFCFNFPLNIAFSKLQWIIAGK